MIETIAILSPIFVSLLWALIFIFSFSRENKLNLLLALFMISAFLLYLSHGLFYETNHLIYFKIEPIYLITNLSVYPLYYLYIRFLTVDQRFKKEHYCHFIPALVIGLSSFIIGLLMNSDERIFYVEEFQYHRNFEAFRSYSASWIRMAIFLLSRIIFIYQVFYALLKGILLIQQHEDRILNSYSNKKGKSLFWVKFMTISFLLTSCVSIVLAIIGRNRFVESKELLIVPSMVFSAMIFLIGFQGNRLRPIPVKCAGDRNLTANGRTRGEMKEKLINLFQDDKIFKNPELKICDISDSIKEDSSNISRLINDEFKVNFCDFVNQYRISVAKTMLLDATDKQLTMSEIAREAGFVSVESFIRVFKEYEGMSPHKFKEIMEGLKATK